MTPTTRRRLVIITLLVAVLVVAGGALRAHAAAPTATVLAEMQAGQRFSAEQQVNRRLSDPRITESSGLAASHLHRDVLYTHNDGGHTAAIFAVAKNGATAATFTLAGVTVRDWEAMASQVDAAGQAWLWVADIGDNSTIRSNGVVVYRVAEPPKLSSATIAASEFTSYRLAYPDGQHNAEALLVDPKTGRLIIVTKQLFGAQAYQAPEQLRPGANPATPNLLQQLPVQSLPAMVTDGVFLPDGRAALLSYGGKITIVSSLEQRSPTVQSLQVNLPQVRMPGQGARSTGLQDPQEESLAVSPDGRWLYVGTEGADSPVVRVAVPGAVQPSGTQQALDSAREASTQAADVVASGARWGLASPLRVVALVSAAGVLLAMLVRWRRRRVRG